MQNKKGVKVVGGGVGRIRLMEPVGRLDHLSGLRLQTAGGRQLSLLED